MANKKPNTSGLKPFKKGTTGNKNGRPKKPVLGKFLADGKKFLKTLENILEHSNDTSKDLTLRWSDPEKVKNLLEQATELTDKFSALPHNGRV